MHIKPPKYSILSKGEQEALEDLQERDDLHNVVIFNAHKGGVVVIMDVTDYIEKAERQSSNKEDYRQRPKDQTAANKGTVNNVMERFQKDDLITKNLVKVLKTTSPLTPRFYIQSKIHK